jgi:hypothetical protein
MVASNWSATSGGGVVGGGEHVAARAIDLGDGS